MKCGAITMTGGGRPSWLARLRAAVTDPNSLRPWSVVANDGIIATAGILEGFAGAGASHATLLTAATSATIAGRLSAGGSEWVDQPRSARPISAPPRRRQPTAP